MNRKIYFASVLILMGCATAKPSGFLDNYAMLSKGQYLEQVMVSPDLKALKGSEIEVVSPQLLDLTPNTEYRGDEAQYYLKNMLEVNLRAESGFRVAADKDAAVLKLETAITKLDPGSRALRWFATEFGAGHSIVQVEGKLIDTASGKVLLRFSDRRAGSGTGGVDITGGDAREMMQSDFTNIAHSLARTLANVDGGI